MRLLALFLAPLLGAATALAQPAPRVTLDVALRMPDGFGPQTIAIGQRVAVAPDGTILVVLEETRSAPDTLFKNPQGRAGASVQLEVIALAHDGNEKFRVAPLRLAADAAGKMTGWPTSKLGIAATRSGDIVIFSGVYLPGGVRARLLRLSPDGAVVHRGELGGPDHPADGKKSFSIDLFVPTPDNALILAGSYGLDPNGWWLGKVALDGRLLWQGGPGAGFPERVLDVGLLDDGSWLALVQRNHSAQDFTVERHLYRYGSTGKLLSSRRLDDETVEALAGLPEGRSVRLDRRHLGYVPAEKDHIERVGVGGEVRWRSGPLLYSDATITPDGDVIALVWPTGPAGSAPPRLMRFSDP